MNRQSPAPKQPHEQNKSQKAVPEPRSGQPTASRPGKAPKTILFVDDEWPYMGAIRRLLPKMRNDWDMRFASSGPEALALLDQKPATVVATDLMMPELDGLQLLAEVARRTPNSIRIIISGHADSDCLLNSAGLCHQFLPKPFDPVLLFQSVDRTYYLQERVLNPELKRLISQIQSLPSLPALYSSLLEELNSEDSSIERVASIVSQDAAMLAKILHAVNMAGFGLTQRISSAAEAVAYLGTGAIKSLVLSSLIFSHFNDLGSSGPRIFFENLWTHKQQNRFIRQTHRPRGGTERADS